MAINQKKFIELIDKVVDDMALVQSKSKRLTFESEPIKSIYALLKVLRSEVLQNPESINTRVLRGMRDVGMAAFKDFENTPLEESIGKLVEELYKDIKSYKNVRPLREEFGKGYPFE